MKHGFGRLCAVLLAMTLVFCACGKKAGAESTGKGTETSEAPHTQQESTAAGTDAAAEADGTAAEETDPECRESSPDSAGAETETWYAPENGELTVTKHKQAGTHMVTAGSLTISIPTTFPGLEQEGAEFSGDDVIVRAGRMGSCRIKYKGAFNSIQINVKNNTDYDMAVRDCTVCGIEVGSQKPDSNLTLYGIPMGATRQQIADVYGEPFSKTFDDENHMSNMVYQFGTDIYSNQVVMIIFKDSKAVSASYDDFSLSRDS